MKKSFNVVLGSVFLFGTTLSQAMTGDLLQRSLYFGVLGGSGSTTWNGLVPDSENQNYSLKLSTPVHVNEGGLVWGGVVGYELNPYFALEGNYMHFPQARIYFDESSIFSFGNAGQREFSSSTQTLVLMAKAMVLLPNTNIRIYSGAGAALLQRKDMLAEGWLTTPSFSVGVNSHFNDRLMAEFAGNYIAGFGDSRLCPSDSYYPFVYSFSLRLIYFLK